MKHDLPPVYCPNLRCRAANAEEDRFCHQCGEALPVRYLWATGKQAAQLPVGTLLGNRFLVRAPRILLETQPGLPANGNVEVPDRYLPYLRLFGYRLHVPELYCLVPYGENDALVGLLEGAPLCAEDLVLPGEPPTSVPLSSSYPLATRLQAIWPQAPFINQLHWLWQIAQLWQPLSSQRVASSLLDLRLLRVENSLLRLLELTPDPPQGLTLVDLGQTWQQHLLNTSAEMAAYLDPLCTQMIDGTLSTTEQLTAHLDHHLGQLQQARSIQIDIATRTDTGPGRNHNEDACYPPHGTVAPNTPDTLVIVCDGVGGHAGGEVASQLAIAATQESLSAADLTQATPDQIVTLLEAAILSANEQIYQRNDQEQRLDRQRMGTTLVMALVHQNQLYLAHVGDSRAYLITRSHCYQVTVDDDIASREVRLGYLPYRDALRYPGSGSLIQALGMAPNTMLRPTVQRFLLAEDCIFLLCSDGLSDHERVDALWSTEILPLLDQKTDLTAVSQRLIEQANQLNGHDNVTVGLLHCTVPPSVEPPTLTLTQTLPVSPTATTLVEPPPKRRSWLLPGLLLLFLVGGGLAYLSWPGIRPNAGPEPLPSLPNPEQFPSPPALGSSSTAPLARGTLLQVLPSEAAAGVQIGLRPDPGSVNAENVQLPAGSILQVLTVFESAAEPIATPPGSTTVWLELQVCSPSPLGSRAQAPATSDFTPSVPASGSVDQPPTTAASEPSNTSPRSLRGWLPEADLGQQIQPINPGEVDAQVRQTCSPPLPAPTSASG